MLAWLGQSIWALIISVILIIAGVVLLIVGWRSKGRTPPVKPLKIGAKVRGIEASGYYDEAFGGYPAGDKQVIIDIILTPPKPMILDIVALEFWGEKFDAKIQGDTAPFDLKLQAPVTLSKAKPYTFTLTCNVPKQFVIDTEDARIYALADGLEWYSKQFPINFGEGDEGKQRPREDNC